MLEVARSVDATPDLIPVLDGLFAGLPALGSAPRRIASLVERFAEPGPRSWVLDLACGKGAVGIEIAARTGCRVVGVDGCEAFVASARDHAAAREVGRRCVWIESDLRDFARSETRRYDVGMMIGLFPLVRAARVLRPLVRPGGLYIVDDVVLDPGDRAAKRFRDVPDREECERAIAMLGDHVEHRVLLPRQAILAQSRGILAKLRRAVMALSGERPDLRRSLREFVARQAKASALLVGPIRPTIWVVRRQ